MDDFSREQKALQDRSQADLIQFLNTDLDLAFTMLQTAQIEAEFDPPGLPVAVQRIRNAVRTIRSLTGRILDQIVSNEIDSRNPQPDGEKTIWLTVRYRRSS